MGGKYIFKNVLGSFIFDQQFKLVEHGSEKLLKKYKKLKEPEGKELKHILEFFRDKKYFKDFYEKNIEITKKGIKESVTNDLLIIQTINTIEEIDKVANMLTKRLREWYSLYNPELSYEIEDHKKFVEMVLRKKNTRKSKGFSAPTSLEVKSFMGAELSEKDLKPILELTDKLNSLYEFRKYLEKYLESLVKDVCPNIAAITGSLIAAKLLEHAGSLKKLVMFPASTIQLLGAEKALFRHMKTGAKCPRHGIIVQHNLISSAPQKEHGKRARALADKISIAAKVDYFKGEFIGDKLREELEKKFK